MHRLVPIVLFATLGVGACTDDNAGGIFIRQAVVPGTDCTTAPMVGEVGISHGELSSLVPTSYEMIAQIQSRITAAVGQEVQRTVILQAAKIDLTFPDSTLFTTAELADMKSKGLTHFKSLFSAPVAPNNSVTDAGFELTTAGLYDAIYAKAPEARMPAQGGKAFELEVLATFTITGTMSGEEVDSQVFEFPVSIANTNSVVLIAGACPLPMGTMPLTGNACGRLQDATTTCCDNSGQLICPATVATMAAP